MNHKRWLQLAALLGVVILIGTRLGCDDDPVGPVRDTGTTGKKDSGTGKQDGPNTTPDTFILPDAPPPEDQGTSDSPVSDVWPGDDASYNTAAPFGCSTDNDCFGQKCCATPWGVKLCAASCFQDP